MESPVVHFTWVSLVRWACCTPVSQKVQPGAEALHTRLHCWFSVTKDDLPIFHVANADQGFHLQVEMAQGSASAFK